MALIGCSQANTTVLMIPVEIQQPTAKTLFMLNAKICGIDLTRSDVEPACVCGKMSALPNETQHFIIYKWDLWGICSPEIDHIGDFLCSLKPK